jgi:hypothetical protein
MVHHYTLFCTNYTFIVPNFHQFTNLKVKLKMNYIPIYYILKVREPTAHSPRDIDISWGFFYVFLVITAPLHLPFLPCSRCAAAAAVLVM